VKQLDNRETLDHKPRVTNIVPKQKYLSKKVGSQWSNCEGSGDGGLFLAVNHIAGELCISTSQNVTDTVHVSVQYQTCLLVIIVHLLSA